MSLLFIKIALCGASEQAAGYSAKEIKARPSIERPKALSTSALRCSVSRRACRTSPSRNRLPTPSRRTGRGCRPAGIMVGQRGFRVAAPRRTPGHWRGFISCMPTKTVSWRAPASWRDPRRKSTMFGRSHIGCTSMSHRVYVFRARRGLADESSSATPSRRSIGADGLVAATWLHPGYSCTRIGAVNSPRMNPNGFWKATSSSAAFVRWGAARTTSWQGATTLTLSSGVTIRIRSMDSTCSSIVERLLTQPSVETG